MTEFVHPGVFVEEVSFRGKPIEGVSTSTAAFVGLADAGPKNPVLVTSLEELERTFGEACELRHAARAFFAAGGRRLFVQRVEDAGAYEDGLRALEGVGEIALVAAPGAPIAEELVEHVRRSPYRFALVDANETAAGLTSANAALYAGEDLDAPASAFAAGIYARTDPVHPRTDEDETHGEGINIVRRSTDGEIGIEGARTLSSDPEWKYVNVRRYFIYLEHSIDRGTQWAVFEPNREELWAMLRTSISDFLCGELRAGRLAGTKPEEAFFVRCDRGTMTQDDLDNGRLSCEVGVAPTHPAEFVVFRIGQWTADRPHR